MAANENFSESNNNDELLQPQSLVIPVIEESLHVEKQAVTTGKLRIEKQVSETNEQVDMNLQRDEYTIRRVAINKYVDEETPQVRHEGNTMIIPVLKEVVVKRLLLVEEVHIIKEVVNSNEQLNIPVRKETVNISRIADNAQPSV